MPVLRSRDVRPSASTRTKPRSRRRPGMLLSVVLLAILLVVLVNSVRTTRPLDATTSSTGLSVQRSVVSTQQVQAGLVEVPDVTAMSLVQAEVLVTAAGLSLEPVSTDTSSSPTPGADAVVTRQEPTAGSLVASSASVKVFLTAKAEDSAGSGTSSKRRFVVCIDPGHQANGDAAPEPVGPGSKTTKPRVTGGATGIKTGIPEYEVVLQISMNLKKRLEQHGVRVVMTRTTNDISLSNAQRAKVANKAKADLFVRVHCDGSPDESAAGVLTLYPASNRWTRSITRDSKRAARVVQEQTLAYTGAVDRGVKPRGDLTGFNWSKVPVVLVECGFMSNPVEDRLLASPHYQDKLAIGMTEGIMAYLGADR